ncbi:hypothetical protein PoB_002602000 [Plakobranchus ocellatus]|uniref:Histone H2A n=1 Tax=Plakobranchus ocellatus TaxID=259542 RepID=A0AAV3ZUK3_9GAST|nr:hypothetical protein PoB_002602000 [Plakobranchus ocellatus]
MSGFPAIRQVRAPGVGKGRGKGGRRARTRHGKISADLRAGSRYPPTPRKQDWAKYQVTSGGAQTRDRRAPVFLRQVRLSPGLAIELINKIKHVGSTAKSIVFAPKHPALPSWPACDCEDQF